MGSGWAELSVEARLYVLKQAVDQLTAKVDELTDKQDASQKLLISILASIIVAITVAVILTATGGK